MAQKILPKPTVFQGVEFRSRLEARWAVFFEAAGVAWNYEPQWISLPRGPYLPDFILPELHLVVEIKPDFQEPAILRLAQAVDVLNVGAMDDADREFYKGILLTQGDLTVPNKHSDHRGAWHTDGILHEDEAYWDRYWWCECPFCGKVGIEYKGWPFEICDHSDYFDTRTTEATPKMRAAYQKALRAFTRAG